MRRLSPISWVLILAGVALLALGIIYFAFTAPDLPSFIPGHVAKAAHARHYTKRGIAAIVAAAIAFAAAALTMSKRPARGRKTEAA